MKRHAIGFVTFFGFLLLCMFSPALLAQVAPALSETPSPVPAVAETQELSVSLVFAFLASSALEWLKRKSWFPVITERTTWLVQRVTGVVVAIATATGINWTFTPDTGQLVITGLLWSSMSAALWDVTRQAVFQEMAYRGFVRPYRPGETV